MFIRFDGLIVGELVNDKLFVKKVKKSKHYIRNFRAYAIQKSIFDLHLKGKDMKIVVEEVDTGNFYVAHVATWEKDGWEFDLGHGTQRALRLKDFTKIKSMEELSEEQVDEGLAQMEFDMAMKREKDPKKGYPKDVEDINADLQIASDADKKDNL